jgi:predicted HAD superfamily phosphohydrolase
LQKSHEEKLAEIRRLAHIVRNELFSERDTLIEMDDYVTKIASAVPAKGGGRMAVFLAYHMGLNTMSKKILELAASDDAKPMEFIVDKIPMVFDTNQTTDQ